MFYRRPRCCTALIFQIIIFSFILLALSYALIDNKEMLYMSAMFLFSPLDNTSVQI